MQEDIVDNNENIEKMIFFNSNYYDTQHFDSSTIPHPARANINNENQVNFLVSCSSRCPASCLEACSRRLQQGWRTHSSTDTSFGTGLECIPVDGRMVLHQCKIDRGGYIVIDHGNILIVC